jgi:hypothetical protein
MPRKADTIKRNSKSEDAKSNLQPQWVTMHALSSSITRARDKIVELLLFGLTLTHIHSVSHDMSSTKVEVMDIPERPPALEFITLTDKPANQKSNFSYLVRSHAMQSVVHERRNPTSKRATSASQRAAEAETKTSKYKELSGNFKLNNWNNNKLLKNNDPTQETVEEIFGIVREEEEKEEKEARLAEVCIFLPISQT